MQETDAIRVVEYEDEPLPCDVGTVAALRHADRPRPVLTTESTPDPLSVFIFESDNADDALARRLSAGDLRQLPAQPNPWRPTDC